MNNKYLFQKQWIDYRRRKTVFVGIFLLYVPLFISLYWVVGFFNLSQKETLLFISFIVFGIIWLISAIRLQLWKCPICHKFFHLKWWYNNIFSSRCLHCKFPKYEGSSFKKN